MGKMRKYDVRLKRNTLSEDIENYGQVLEANDLYPFIENVIKAHESPTERLWVVLFDAQAHITGYAEVAKGTMTTVPSSVKDFYAVPMLANAHSVIAVHNHPSGRPTPSRDDIHTTAKLKLGGEILGIELLDHIIVGEKGNYSAASSGWMPDVSLGIPDGSW